LFACNDHVLRIPPTQKKYISGVSEEVRPGVKKFVPTLEER
jgi:hypothetical protein